MQLRSPSSPRELSFEFGLPSGGRLEALTRGGKPTGAVAIFGANKQIGVVHPAVAKDAAGVDVPVNVGVDGRTLTLSVDVRDDVAWPVLVDPIIEGQFPGGDQSNPNTGFTNTRGWRRESSLGLGAFTFVPKVDNPPGDGSDCLRTLNSGVLQFISHTICVGTKPTTFYPISASFQSIGAWSWHPPAGQRSSANNVPAPNTDAFVYRADVRNGYLDGYRPGGNTAMVGGLISGRTRSWIGTHGVLFSDTPGDGVTGTNPFVIDFSESSYLGTYCARADCSAQLNSSVYDGTYMSFGVFTAGGGQIASALAQGARFYQSDRSAPIVGHVAVSDPQRWYRSGSFISRASATDVGMGMDRLGVSFPRADGGTFIDAVDLPCDGMSPDGGAHAPCLSSIPARNFVYDTGLMAEGRNTVSAVGIDIIGRSTTVGMAASAAAGAPAVKVKVDRSAPRIDGGLSGSLFDNDGKAVTDGIYDLQVKVKDGLSGIQSFGYTLDDGTPVTGSALSCPAGDCPLSPAAKTISIDTSQLSAGVHKVHVYAKDAAGNVLDQLAVTFNVDHDAPQITAVTHDPQLSGWFGLRSLTVQATATDDASGVKLFTLSAPTADGSTTETDTVVSDCDETIANKCDSPASGDIAYETGALGDGAARALSLTASDALGQRSAPPEQWTVDVDTRGPALMLSGPAWDARDSYIGAGALELQASAADSVDGEQRSGVRRITLRVDGEPPQGAVDDSIIRPVACVSSESEPCDLSGSLTVPGGLSDGRHTIYVTATDQAQPANTTTESFELLVDTTRPTITDLAHTPAGVARWRDDVPRSVDVSATDELSGVSQFTMSLPDNTLPPPPPAVAPFDVDCTGPTDRPCPQQTTGTLAYETGALDEGEREPSVVATDRAGNTSTPSEWTLRLDRSAPAAEYSGSLDDPGGTILVSGTADLRVDATDGFSGVREIRFSVDGQERQSKQADCDQDGCPGMLTDTFVVQSDAYAPGEHTLTVRVTDQVGAPVERHVITKQYEFSTVAGSDSSPRRAVGLEDFWQYDSTPTGAGSAAHVNMATGNMVWHKVPIVNPGRGLSSVVNLTYNSHDTSGLVEDTQGPPAYKGVGRGFSLGISGLSRINEPLRGVSVLGLPTVPSQIGLTDVDGTRHTFGQIAGSTEYSHPPGVNLRLRQFTAPPLIPLLGGDTSKTWAITRPDGTTFYYDAQGYETSIEDRNSNIIRFEYERYSPATGNDPAGLCTGLDILGLPPLLDGTVCAKRVTRVIDPAGRSIEIKYRTVATQSGTIDRIIDHRKLTPSARRAMNFVYDDNGYLTQIQEARTEEDMDTPQTRVTRFGYTSNGGSAEQQLREVVDPLGQGTVITYKAPNAPAIAAGKGGPAVAKVTDRRDHETNYEFGFFAQNTNAIITDALDRKTRYTLDAASRPTEKTDARSTRTELAWDPNNNVERLTTAAGSADEAVAEMTYNQNGLLRTRTDPESTPQEPKVLTLDYDDGSGTQTTGSDVGGVFVSDLVSITRPEGNSTTFERDTRGNAIKRTDGEGNVASTTFDGFGQIKQEIDEVGNVTKFEEYDPNGLPQRVIDPRGNAQDPDANGGRWIYRYDEVGNVLSATDPRAGGSATVDDPGEDFTTTLTYDALDRLTRTSTPKDSADPDPGRSLIHDDTDYDANDNITQRIDGNRNVTSAQFTATDQVSSVTLPAVPHGEDGTTLTSEITRFAYDEVDNKIRMISPRGSATATDGDFETEYRYSPIDEMVAEIRRSTDDDGPSALATSWAYDRRGNQIGMVDPRQNKRFGGIPRANAQQQNRRRMSWEYDKSDNRVAQVEDPGGIDDRREWEYDLNDRVVAKVDPRGNEPGADPDDFTWTYTYDQRDLVTQTRTPAVTHVGESGAARRMMKYTRRPDGKPIEVTSPRGTQTSNEGDFVTELDYDANGALSSRTLPRAPDQYGPTLQLSYERDPAGNPKTITDPRRHSFSNTFYDSGALKSTERPSWWTYDAQTMSVAERPLEDIMADNGKPDQPPEQSAAAKTDFGDVQAEPMPDWMPDAGMTRFGYDQLMRLTSVTDVADNTSLIKRDALGRVQSTKRPFDRRAETTSPAERDITHGYDYDLAGNIVTETDGEQQKTTYSYDQFDRRISEVTPGSESATEVTGYEHDPNSNVTTVRTPRLTEIGSEFDRLDRKISQTNPEGEQATYSYDAAGNRISERSPRGNLAGLSTADRDRFETSWEFNATGNMTSITNGLGAQTRFGYDRDANQVRVSAPGAADSLGETESAVDRVTTRTFEGRGLLWTQTTGSGADALTMAMEFDGNGNPRREIKPRGIAADGKPAASDDQPPDNGGDDFPAVTDSSNAMRHATVREFSDDDLLQSIHMPFGPGDGENGEPQRERFRMNFVLDERGRVTAIDAPYEWSQEDQKAQRTKYGHYSNGWVRSVSDVRVATPGSPVAESVEHNYEYSYDRRGLQTVWESKDPDTGAGKRRIERDYYPNMLLQRRSAFKDRGDQSPRRYRYEYDQNRSLTRLIDPQTDGGRTINVAYDDADRSIRVNETWNGGRDTVYGYDENSNVDLRRVDGRLADGSFEGGRTTRFEFDELDRETKATVMVTGEDRVTDTTYWPSDQVRKREKAKGAVERMYFDDQGRISRMRRVKNDDPDDTVKNQGYDYDANGNRESDERGDHEFNARDQLTRWTRGDQQPKPDTTVDYELNASGATVSRTDSSLPDEKQTTEFVYRESEGPGGEFIGDRLIKTIQDEKTTIYEYNEVGDVTKINAPDGNDQDVSYTYDAFGRRTKSNGPGSAGDESYAHDALDRRDMKTRGDTTFEYNYVGLTEKLSRERTGDGSESRTYDYDSALRRMGQSHRASAGAQDEYRSYATDANGSVEGLEQDDGDLTDADSYRYDPYGEIEGDEQDLSDAAADAPFRFEGFYLDSGVKTYDMQARSYRPQIGRFLAQDRYQSAGNDLNLQSDPLTQNRYAFAGGNPVNRIEFDGHFQCPNELFDRLGPYKRGQACPNGGTPRGYVLDADGNAVGGRRKGSPDSFYPTAGGGEWGGGTSAQDEAEAGASRDAAANNSQQPQTQSPKQQSPKQQVRRFLGRVGEGGVEAVREAVSELPKIPGALLDAAKNCGDFDAEISLCKPRETTASLARAAGESLWKTCTTGDPATVAGRCATEIALIFWGSRHGCGSADGRVRVVSGGLLA